MLLAILALWLFAVLPGALRVVVARLGGMLIYEASLGVGRVLWRHGAFRLRAFPVGLFVRVAGLVPGERPFSPEEPRAFGNRPPPFQFLLHISGIISYYIFAAALMAALFMIWGRPVEGKAPILGTVKPGMPAEAAGLQPGDEIVSIGGLPVEETTQVAPDIDASKGRPTEIVVLRDGQRRSFTFTAVESDGRWRIGVEIWAKEEYVKGSLGESLLEGARWPYRYAEYIARFVADQYAGGQRLEFTGPVGIVKVTKHQSERGAREGVSIVAILAVYAMLFLALPIPGVDGGRLVAWIFRRRKRATGEAKDLGTVEKTKMRMPLPVAATLALWTLAAAAAVMQATRDPSAIVELLFVAGIVYGIARRHPAAWRLGKILPFAAVFKALYTAEIALAAFFLVAGALALLPSTARWFGMVCPACGSRECGSSSAHAYGCVACGSVWKLNRA